MLIFGIRHYGKTDEIEGLGWVKTRFVHVWYIPLIPVGSMFVVQETDKGVRGMNLGLSLRSVVSVWGRAGAMISGLLLLGSGVVVGFGGLVDVVDALPNLHQSMLPRLLQAAGFSTCGVCASIACFGSFYLLGRLFGVAKGARRSELLAKLGVQSDPVVTGQLDGLDG